MHLVAGDEGPKVLPELALGVGGNVMKFINRDQPVVKLLDTELVHGEAEGSVGADQHPFVAIEERAEGIDLAAVVGSGRVAEIPFRCNSPISPEAVFGQRL